MDYSNKQNTPTSLPVLKPKTHAIKALSKVDQAAVLSKLFADSDLAPELSKGFSRLMSDERLYKESKTVIIDGNRCAKIGVCPDCGDQPLTNYCLVCKKEHCTRHGPTIPQCPECFKETLDVFYLYDCTVCKEAFWSDRHVNKVCPACIGQASCTKCGTKYPEQDIHNGFCRHCIPTPTQPEEASSFCSHCTKQLPQIRTLTSPSNFNARGVNMRGPAVFVSSTWAYKVGCKYYCYFHVPPNSYADIILFLRGGSGRSTRLTELDGDGLYLLNRDRESRSQNRKDYESKFRDSRQREKFETIAEEISQEQKAAQWPKTLKDQMNRIHGTIPGLGTTKRGDVAHPKWNGKLLLPYSSNEWLLLTENSDIQSFIDPRYQRPSADQVAQRLEEASKRSEVETKTRGDIMQQRADELGRMINERISELKPESEPVSRPPPDDGVYEYAALVDSTPITPPPSDHSTASVPPEIPPILPSFYDSFTDGPAALFKPRIVHVDGSNGRRHVLYSQTADVNTADLSPGGVIVPVHMAPVLIPFLNQFKPEMIDSQFIEMMYRTGDVPFGFSDVTGTLTNPIMGNWTGRGHPATFDYLDRKSWPIPANPIDFISMLHDLSSNDDGLSTKELEQFFIDLWRANATSPVEHMVPLAMQAKQAVTTDYPEDINYELLSLLTSSKPDTAFNADITPINITGFHEEVTDTTSGGLPGGGRFDEVKFDRTFVALGPHEETAKSDYQPGAFPSFETQPSDSQFIPNIRFSAPLNRLMPTLPNFYSAADGVVQSSTLVHANHFGAVYSPTLPCSVYDTTGPLMRYYRYRSMPMIPKLRRSPLLSKDNDSSCGVTKFISDASWLSLGMLSPGESYTGVASGNRSYASTPYGNQSTVLTINARLNAVPAMDGGDFAWGYCQALRWRNMNEAGDWDSLHRGANTFNVRSTPAIPPVPVYNSKAFFSTPNATDAAGIICTQYYGNENPRTLIFVDIVQLETVHDTAAATFINNIINSQECAILYLGGSGDDATKVFRDDTFLIQMIMSAGFNGYCTWNLPAYYQTDGTRVAANQIYMDTSCIFQTTDYKKTYLVVITNVRPNRNVPWKAGPFVTATTAAYQNYTVCDLSAPLPLLDYDLDDTISSWFTVGGYQYWNDVITSFAMATGTGHWFNEMALWCKANFSVRTSETDVIAYVDGAGNYALAVGGTAPNLYAVPAGTPNSVATGNYTVVFPNGADLRYQTSLVVPADYINLVEDKVAYLPLPTGKEWYVYAGFAKPIVANIEPVIGYRDLQHEFTERFWLPEAVEQTYWECYEIYGFPRYMMYKQIQANVPTIPLQFTNMHLCVDSLSGTSPVVPTSLPFLQNRLSEIIGMDISKYGYILACWDPRTQAINPGFGDPDMMNPANLRPEFVCAISKSSNHCSLILAQRSGEWPNSPKISSSDSGYTYYRDAAPRLYEANVLCTTQNYAEMVEPSKRKLAQAVRNWVALESYTNTRVVWPSYRRGETTYLGSRKIIPAITYGPAPTTPTAWIGALVNNIKNPVWFDVGYYLCYSNIYSDQKPTAAIMTPTSLVPYPTLSNRPVISWAAGDPFGYNSKVGIMSYYGALDQKLEFYMAMPKKVPEDKGSEKTPIRTYPEDEEQNPDFIPGHGNSYKPKEFKDGNVPAVTPSGIPSI